MLDLPSRVVSALWALLFLCCYLDVAAAGSLIDLATAGDIAGVRAEIQAGASVDAVDGDGNSALHWASWEGHAEVVKELLNAGAAVDKTDGPMDGNTALMKASWNGHSTGHEDIIRALLDAGAEVMKKNVYGSTSLHNAAMGGHNKIAKILIDVGKADVNARDQGGVTPLHKAAYKGYNKVIETLLAAGANVNVKRDDGITPIILAESFHFGSTVELLKSKGAQIPKMQKVDL